jgi:hypothetical protein
MARLLNDGTTVVALQHRFRPLKREGAEMKAGISAAFDFNSTPIFQTSRLDPKTSNFPFVKSPFVLPHPSENPLRF